MYEKSQATTSRAHLIHLRRQKHHNDMNIKTSLSTAFEKKKNYEPSHPLTKICGLY